MSLTYSSGESKTHSGELFFITTFAPIFLTSANICPASPLLKWEIGIVFCIALSHILSLVLYAIVNKYVNINVSKLTDIYCCERNRVIKEEYNYVENELYYTFVKIIALLFVKTTLSAFNCAFAASIASAAPAGAFLPSSQSCTEPVARVPV